MNTKYCMHTDGFDAGPSRMVALGEFCRGRLWLHASKTNSWSGVAAQSRTLLASVEGVCEVKRMSCLGRSC